MRKLGAISLALSLTVLCVIPVRAQEAKPLSIAPTEMAARAIEGFIIPGYQQVRDEAATQKAIFETLCSAPSDSELTAAREQFPNLVESWSRIQIIRFGSVVYENRLERILFWPDRKSTGLKQVQAALIGQDETVTSLDSLQQKSVALQGLAALEFVLFGTGWESLATQEGAFRCQYGRTIAAAIENTATSIVTDWQTPGGTADHLRDPDPGHRDYRNETEVLRELFSTFVHASEMMRDTRIAAPLGDGPDSANPKLALFWRAGLSIEELLWTVDGLETLLATSGLRDVLMHQNDLAMGSYLFELNNFRRVANELEQPLADVLADPSGWSKVNYLYILTQSLQSIAVDQLANYLGIGVGFSSLDGD